MTDNHVHVGWYSDGYHAPRTVWRAAWEAGITNIVVSSTSTCAELYKLAAGELCELKRLGGSRVHPILWLTPRMMNTWGIRYMLRCGILWEGVKMHWEAHREWYYNRRLTGMALQVARRLGVPVLLHTGDFKECHAGVFQSLCGENPDINFVLAHGRPAGETLEVMAACHNTRADTAFMPPQDARRICNAGYAHRLLFGTDAPINLSYYKDMTTAAYIRRCADELRKALTPAHYTQMMQNTFYSNSL